MIQTSGDDSHSLNSSLSEVGVSTHSSWTVHDRQLRSYHRETHLRTIRRNMEVISTSHKKPTNACDRYLGQIRGPCPTMGQRLKWHTLSKMVSSDLPSLRYTREEDVPYHPDVLVLSSTVVHPPPKHRHRRSYATGLLPSHLSSTLDRDCPSQS